MLIKSQTPLAYNRKNKKGRGRGRRKTWKPPLFFALDAGMTSLLALTCPSYVGWLITPPILFENAINLCPATQVVKDAGIIVRLVVGCILTGAAGYIGEPDMFSEMLDLVCHS